MKIKYANVPFDEDTIKELKELTGIETTSGAIQAAVERYIRYVKEGKHT